MKIINGEILKSKLARVIDSIFTDGLLKVNTNIQIIDSETKEWSTVDIVAYKVGKIIRIDIKGLLE
jgi:predicted RecB family endonuclease